MSELLPPNWSPQEYELAGQTERVSAIPVPVREVWSPMTCPAGILPWLAWALRVDNWNADWTDAQKRTTIANSISVHRKKGTAEAVKQALSVLGYNVDVTENTGTAYTFYVDMDATGGMPTEAIFAAAADIANNTKNARSHLLGVRSMIVTTDAAEMGMNSIGGDTTTIWPFVTRLLSTIETTVQAAAVQVIDMVTITPNHGDQNLSGTISAGGLVTLEMIYG